MAGGCHNERLHSLLQSRNADSGELTKNINVISDLLCDINDIKYLRS